MNTYSYKYPRPMVTADAVIFNENTQGMQLLLIKRGNDPYKDCWALPGGFVDMEEDLLDAAARELFEETGLKCDGLTQIGAFGKPGRDPRGRNICIAYGAITSMESPSVEGGDDASDARFFPIEKLPPLAFDHDKIIEKAVRVLNINADNF